MSPVIKWWTLSTDGDHKHVEFSLDFLLKNGVEDVSIQECGWLNQMTHPHHRPGGHRCNTQPWCPVVQRHRRCNQERKYYTSSGGPSPQTGDTTKQCSILFSFWKTVLKVSIYFMKRDRQTRCWFFYWVEGTDLVNIINLIRNSFSSEPIFILKSNDDENLLKKIRWQFFKPPLRLVHTCTHAHSCVHTWHVTHYS